MAMTIIPLANGQSMAIGQTAFNGSPLVIATGLATLTGVVASIQNGTALNDPVGVDLAWGNATYGAGNFQARPLTTSGADSTSSSGTLSWVAIGMTR